MATLGNVPAEAYTNTVKDSFSGNGSATAFTMSLPTVTNDVRVVVENVIQDPTVAYSVSGTTLTFTSAPPTGTNNIYVVHLGPAAMTAVPPAEIADATTFASSLTVQGAFTSVGIDDNADATAITIDSNEGVNIGKTSASLGSVGLQLSSIGYSAITTNHNTDTEAPLRLNRLNGDGALLKVFKDSSEVGSIGVNSGDNLYLAGGTGSTKGIYFNDNGMVPADTGGSPLDNGVDLGVSNNRWKDLYLSGGVYLGGTGSANKLDDYEEGTFTPTVTGSASAGTTTYTSQAGYYTKIGRLVNISCIVNWSAMTGSGFMELEGIPFPIANLSPGSQNYPVGAALPSNINWTGGTMLVGLGLGGSSTIALYGSSDNGGATRQNCVNENANFRLTMSYMTT